jgi:hypothetical protein
MQFIQDGRRVAVVAGRKVTLQGKRTALTSESEPLAGSFARHFWRPSKFGRSSRRYVRARCEAQDG